MTRRRRRESGLRIKHGKYEWFARINGKYESKGGFPYTDAGRQAARDARQKAIDAGIQAQPELPEGSFAAQVMTYLQKPTIAAMTTLDERTAHLTLWLEALGHDRPPTSITRDDIEAVLQHWLKTLSPVTVYHRRTALGSFFDTIYPMGPNPVRGTTRPDHYRPTDRSQPFALMAQIVAAMATWRYVKKGIRQLALAKLWAAVILHTGIPPAELLKLRRHHFDRVRGILRMPWRDKGAGTPAHTRELSPDGVAAIVALDAADGWGAFVEEALSHSFKRAARRVCGPDTPICLYDLRHCLGADSYRSTRDLATVGRLLGHAPGSVCTARYAMGANADVDRQAIAAVATARAAQIAPAAGNKSALKLPAKVARLRKRGKQKTLVAAS